MNTKLKLSTLYPQKRAFITGAGSGLGAELAQLLLADGWTLGLTDLTFNQKNETMQFYDKKSEVSGFEEKQVEDGKDKRVYWYFFDVSNAQEFQKASEDFLAKVGGVDLVFNNAGVGEGDYFEDYSLENWDWIIGVNQKGVINGCHFFVPTLKKQKSGMIINIASAAGYANLPKMSPYNVTKASVIALSESLYGELKPHSVKVIAITPTFFQSNILENSRSSSEQIKQSAKKVVSSAKMDSKEAALLILKRLPKTKRHIRFPFSASLLFYLKKWLPNLYWWAIIKKLSS